jgi:cellulose synthase/poly-beta-1,6-N-acetylglucosamine synthase-like glycosyltransferase
MIADRFASRPDPRPTLELIESEPLDSPCHKCGLVVSTAARFCRRCGERQQIAQPIVEADATESLSSRPQEPAGGSPATFTLPGAERPPLVPLWGPFDDMRVRATGEVLEPSTSETDGVIATTVAVDPPTPALFHSFVNSAWSPKPTDDLEAVETARDLGVAAGRCTHPQRGRSRPALCAICGGIPGPRVVTARTAGGSVLPPEMSAERTLSSGQRRAILVALPIAAALFLIAPMATLIAGIAMATVLYAAVMVQRVRIFRLALDAPDMISVSDADARAIPGSKLPIYTILIPAYREPEVIGRLLESIRALEYPIHKLDIKLLLEQDDPETLEAAHAASPGSHLEIVRVPPLGPRTKPKACQVGLARARGQYVTIFDAEDQPEPLQLRRAIVAFRRHPEIACFQAILSYRNAGQNMITRWFTAEYAMWFRQFLPGLVRLGAPLPLGGTSNHFRRNILRSVGGWDPYNVTEDADLGIRLTRAGHRTAVLDSTTMEEANSDFVNWAKQRSRWYKGYLQTWLIHMRQPRRLWRELGPRGFVGFNLFVGGTPLVAVLNPLFWAMTAIWFVAHPDIIQSLFPSWLYYAGLACLVGGNFVFLYGSVVSARSTGRPDVVLAAVLSPIYWVMMSIAALKAAVQLISAPSYWEKTTHGLDLEPIARRNALRGPSA